jgi:hypothetical protein
LPSANVSSPRDERIRALGGAIRDARLCIRQRAELLSQICQKLLPRRGRALAVADGEGRNGVWLAEQGLDVVSVDFSAAAQDKARALAAERGVKVTLVKADVHVWDYPQATFDVRGRNFCAIQSVGGAHDKMARHAARAQAGRASDHSGLYARKQLQHGTGGPKRLENLYTRPMLEQEFGAVGGDRPHRL